MIRKLAFAVFFSSLFVAVQAQEKVRISDKIELAKENPPEGLNPAELKVEFEQYFKALEQELKAQAVGFNAECQWLISVKLVIKPKSKVIEVMLDPGRPASPRIMTTAFLRRADFESDDAFKEAVKSAVKMILTRAASC